MILLRQRLFAELKDVGYDQMKLKEIKDRQKKAAEKRAERAAKKASREKYRFKASGDPYYKSLKDFKKSNANIWERDIARTQADATRNAIKKNRIDATLLHEELQKGATRKTVPASAAYHTAKTENQFIQIKNIFGLDKEKPINSGYTKGSVTRGELEKRARSLKNRIRESRSAKKLAKLLKK